MKTLLIASITSLLSLYIGLECGHRIGTQQTLKQQKQWITKCASVSSATGTDLYQILTGEKRPRFGGLGNGQ